MEQLLDRIYKAPASAKFGGIFGAVLLLTLVNYFFFIDPVETQITQAIDNQSGLERQLAEKQEIAQNLNERRREMSGLEEKLAEALTELPEKSDVEELLAQLNDVGKKSGLEIAKVEPTAE